MLTVGEIQSLPTTLDVDAVAEIWGCSTWAVYEMERKGASPVKALRLGRKMRWPTLLVLRSVGVEPAADREENHSA